MNNITTCHLLACAKGLGISIREMVDVVSPLRYLSNRFAK